MSRNDLPQLEKSWTCVVQSNSTSLAQALWKHLARLTHDRFVPGVQREENNSGWIGLFFYADIGKSRILLNALHMVGSAEQSKITLEQAKTTLYPRRAKEVTDLIMAWVTKGYGATWTEEDVTIPRLDTTDTDALTATVPMTPAPLEYKQLYDVEVEVDTLNAWFVDYCEANLDKHWTIHNAFGSWQIIAGKVGYPFSKDQPAFVEIVSTGVIPVLSIRTTPIRNGKVLAQFTIFNDSEWLAGISHWSDTSVTVEAIATPKNERKRYEDSRMVTHTFKRPVSPSRFVAWLRDRCSVHLLSRGQLGDPENKYQTVSIVNFIPDCKHRGRDYELVWNVAIVQDDVLHEKEAITFYISELLTDPVSTKVAARCSFPIATSYYEYLLEECDETLVTADTPAAALEEETKATNGHEGQMHAEVHLSQAPWDQLKNKKRWSPDDWIYLFTHLVQESQTVNVTPNFAKIEQMIERNCDTRKDEKYIKKQYYAVFYPTKGNK